MFEICSPVVRFLISKEMKHQETLLWICYESFIWLRFYLGFEEQHPVLQCLSYQG